MFVYTYICYLKTVQNILAIWWIWGQFIYFSINSCSQGSAFFTTFWHIFDNKILHVDLSETFQMCKAICCKHKTFYFIIIIYLFIIFFCWGGGHHT